MHKTTVLASALALAIGCQAQTMDLLTAYSKARARDANLAAARHALEIAFEKVPQARAALLPTLNLNANVNRQEGDASFGGAADVRRQSRNWSWVLQINHPLLRQGNRIALEQAQLQLQLAEYQLWQTEQELILRLAQNYLEALQEQQNLQVMARQIESLEQQLVLATRNFTAGLTTVTDIHEAQSRLDVAHAQWLATRATADNKLVELERILGQTLDALKPLDPEADLPAMSLAQQNEWLGHAQQYSIAVRIAQLQVSVSEKEILRAGASHLPTLDLSANHGANSSSGSVTSPANISTRTLSSQLGLQFSVPLYAGGGITSRAREAIAVRNKLMAELEAAKRLARSQIQQALNSILSSEAQQSRLNAALLSTKRAVDATKIGYRLGTRINVDVLNAEQQMFNVQREVFKTRVDRLLQGLKLKAVAGVLTTDDLAAINAMLTDK